MFWLQSVCYIANFKDIKFMNTAEKFSSFSSLGLPDDICKAVRELGYETPTSVQQSTIPIILSGRDLIGQAQTGTGKTGAFALPLISKIDFKSHTTQVLVLAPTRELAIQVAEAFKSYARGQKNFHVLPIYGGQSIQIQLRQLSRNPHVIVGTPGRVMDHLRRKTLSLKSLKALVLDEADEMLSMGFIEDIQWIMDQAPSEKQTALFSATMPKAIRNIAQKYLNNPEEVVIEQVASAKQLINQSHWVVTGVHKLDALTRILEVVEVDGVLIFMRTKTATMELTEKLEARGYSAGALNGDMSQDARERTVQAFKKGRHDVLVATDVAARGLDIDRISHVINYDAPFDLQTYTHRIGRTGRAGRAGAAILFVSPREMGILRSIERAMKTKIAAFKMPTREDLGNRRIDRFVSKVKSAIEHTDLTPYASILEKVAEKTEAPVEVVASALCSLLHQESPLFVDKSDVEIKAAPAEEVYRGKRGPRRGGKPGGRGERRRHRKGGSGSNLKSPHRGKKPRA